MKKTLRKMLVLLACIGLILIISKDTINEIYATDASDVQNAQNEAQETQKKIDELNNKLASLAGNISETEAYINELDATVENLSNQLFSCQDQVTAKQQEIDTKQQEISEKQQEIDDSQAELDAAKQTETEQYEAMKKRIQYMYECGEETFLDLIFSSKDLSEMLGRTEYVNDITSYDRNQIEILVDTQNKIASLITIMENDKVILESQKTALETEKTELVTLQQSLEQQQSYINSLLDNKKVALGNLESLQASTAANKSVEESKLAAQKAEADRLLALWKQEQAQINGSGGNADEANALKLQEIGLSGGFTWPLPGYNYITSHFGPRNLQIGLMNLANHSGIDISGSGVYGKPVVAAYSGTVRYTDVYAGNMYTQPYGTRVEIDHGSGVVTLYAHLSKLAVSTGQTVKAGDVIGYVGSTGASTGAHLHLTLYLKGVLTDPEDYFTIPTY